MRTLLVRCECGERFEADAAAATIGTVRCPKCGRKLKIKRIREGTRARPAKTSAGSRFLDNAEAAFASATKSFKRAGRLRELTPFARVVTILCWAYAVFAFLLVIVAWGTGDEWWLGTVLLFIGRWIFLLPLLALVPAALMVRASLLAPLALAAVMITGPVMGARVGFEGLLPAPAGERIRVVTFNTGGSAGTAVGLEFLLERWDADIVAFQECSGPLKEAIGQVGAGWHHHHGERGLCLVTRFPIRSTSIMDRKTLDLINEKGGGIGGSGDVIRYALHTPAGVVQFTNVHLETPRKGFEALFSGAGGGFALLRQNTKLRDAESSLARRHVDAGGIPLIVAGDFNTTVESRIFQRHWRDFKDAFSRAGVGFGMTKHNGWIRVRIDHVLTDDSFGITDVRVGEDRGSDHRPVIADLVLKKKR